MAFRLPPLLPLYAVLLGAALLAPYLFPAFTPYLFWALTAWLVVSLVLLLRPVLARRLRARRALAADPGPAASPAASAPVPDDRILGNLAFCFRCGTYLDAPRAACPACGRRLGIG